MSPPVSATACTNPVVVATYLAEISESTDPVELARDIVDTFRKDLSEGVIQQSMLHFSPQYVGNPPGMPDVVMFTDNGVIPPMRTPPDVELTASHGELYFQAGGGIVADSDPELEYRETLDKAAGLITTLNSVNREQ